MRKAGLLVAALTLACGPARAGELFAGLYRHDIDDQLSIGGFEGGKQVIVGARTTALDELKPLGRPRVHLLVGINTSGGTDFVAAGLSWRLNLTRRLYLQPGIGLAVHDGRIDLPSPDAPGITAAERAKRLRDLRTKLDLGSRVLFEPELALGYKATRRLSAELSYIHLSHGQIFGAQNPGLGELGLRLVYRYGLDR